MVIAQQDGVRTFMGVDRIVGDPVLAHVLDDTSLDARTQISARLAQLTGADAAVVIESTVTERGWAVITRAEEGLDSFMPWLRARTQSAPAQTPVSVPEAGSVSSGGTAMFSAVVPPMASIAPPTPTMPARLSLPVPLPLPAAAGAPPLPLPLPPVPAGGSPAGGSPAVAALPAAPVPVAPVPVVIPAAVPPVAGEFTQMFRPIGDAPPPPSRVPPVIARPTPEVQTGPPAPPPQPPPAPPVAARPLTTPTAAPGEFTSMFIAGAHLGSGTPAFTAGPPVPVVAAVFPVPLSELPPSSPPLLPLPERGLSARPAVPLSAGVSALPPLPPLAAPVIAIPGSAQPPAPGALSSFVPPSLAPPAFTAAPLVPPRMPPPMPPPPIASVARPTPPPAGVSPLPPVLSPPTFGLPAVSAGVGGRGAPAAPSSEYTMIMKSAVQAVEAPAVREPVSASVPAAKPRRLTMPVILMINAVILLTLGLFGYFALRTKPAPPATSNGAVPVTDSATGGGAARRDSVAR